MRPEFGKQRRLGDAPCQIATLGWGNLSDKYRAYPCEPGSAASHRTLVNKIGLSQSSSQLRALAYELGSADGRRPLINNTTTLDWASLPDKRNHLCEPGGEANHRPLVEPRRHR